jgi:hypothetical protein
VQKFYVSMLDGSSYGVGRLLGKPMSNAKIAKSNKYATDIMSVSLSLAPASVSGFNLCASSSAGCRHGCLFTSGYAKVNPRAVQPARIAKARMLRINKEEFQKRLLHELKHTERAANKRGQKLFVRLNVVSDVMWEREIPDIFTNFPNVQFYDYTKHAERMRKWLRKELPANLHLTFSWSGVNKDQCLEVLRNGGNVAVPFQVKYFRDKYDPLPNKFLRFRVFDGDQTDLRPLDPSPRVIGLRAKGEAKKDNISGFVVVPTASRGNGAKRHGK